jgi:hypothetical protein
MASATNKRSFAGRLSLPNGALNCHRRAYAAREGTGGAVGIEEGRNEWTVAGAEYVAGPTLTERVKLPGRLPTGVVVDGAALLTRKHGC